jgi:hypothetical protein
MRILDDEQGCTWGTKGIEGRYFGIRIKNYQPAKADKPSCLLCDVANGQWYTLANARVTDREQGNIGIHALELSNMNTESWMSRLKDGALIIQATREASDYGVGTLLNEAFENGEMLCGKYFVRVGIAKMSTAQTAEMESFRARYGTEAKQKGLDNLIRTGTGVMPNGESHNLAQSVREKACSRVQCYGRSKILN